MEKTVYLDNSSTTAPCPEAVAAANEALTSCWGNPSSLHILGFNAERKIEEARGAIAAALGAEAREIYFNSCGTEGDNTAILGAARARKKRGNKIITTTIEHPAVLQTVKVLEDEGFDVVYIKPDSNGVISLSELEKETDQSTILISVMLVNNEIGSIQPVEKIPEIIKSRNAPALLHTDAVQAFGKLPINVKRLGADLLTVSGHKIHAPKGIGALYVKNGVYIKPFITGGGQEKGFRSGTESVPLISAFGAAAKALPELKAQYKKQEEFISYAKAELHKTGLFEINSPENALPYIINVSVPGYRSETLLHFLENENIFVSSGSACSKGKGSYVLREIGLSAARADSALRLSFSRFNEKEDIDLFIDAIKRATEKLRRAKV